EGLVLAQLTDERGHIPAVRRIGERAHGIPLSLAVVDGPAAQPLPGGRIEDGELRLELGDGDDPAPIGREGDSLGAPAIEFPNQSPRREVPQGQVEAAASDVLPIWAQSKAGVVVRGILADVAQLSAGWCVEYR